MLMTNCDSVAPVKMFCWSYDEAATQPFSADQIEN